MTNDTQDWDRPTPDERAAVLVHFAEWSGGFTPAECDDATLRSYLDYGRIHDERTVTACLWLDAE